MPALAALAESNAALESKISCWADLTAPTNLAPSSVPIAAVPCRDVRTSLTPT